MTGWPRTSCCSCARRLCFCESQLLACECLSTAAGFTAAEAGDDTRISKNRPYMGRVVESEGLCNIQGPEDKDTLRVEIDLGTSGLEYVPGDALGIHASNAPEVPKLPHTLAPPTYSEAHPCPPNILVRPSCLAPSPRPSLNYNLPPCSKYQKMVALVYAARLCSELLTLSFLSILLTTEASNIKPL